MFFLCPSSFCNGRNLFSYKKNILLLVHTFGAHAQSLDKKIVLTRIVLPAHVLCIVASLVELSFTSIWPKFIVVVVVVPTCS